MEKKIVITITDNSSTITISGMNTIEVIGTLRTYEKKIWLDWLNSQKTQESERKQPPLPFIDSLDVSVEEKPQPVANVTIPIPAPANPAPPGFLPLHPEKIREDIARTEQIINDEDSPPEMVDAAKVKLAKLKGLLHVAEKKK